MKFIETSIFTKQIQELLSDEEYRQLQIALLSRPDMGVIIPGGGGLRKIRWRYGGKGKRAGIRTIYYWAVALDQILMLFAYAKNEMTDLTPAQLKVLRNIIDEEYL